MTSTNAKPPGNGAAWTVLLSMGGTNVVFNIYHATHAGHMRLALALLFGIAPVAASMGMSHLVAVHRGGPFMKAVTFIVMLFAMSMSIGATASVVSGTAGPYSKWIFGGVLDAASLIALRVIFMDPAAGPDEAPAGATGWCAAGASQGPMGGAIEGPAGGASEGPARGAIEGPAGGASEGPAGGAARPAGGGARERGHGRVVRASQEPDAIAARKAYRKSVQNGAPLKDRQLAAMFEPRSRNWAAARIEEADRQPSLAASRTASE